jgi:hypothetical protein
MENFEKNSTKKFNSRSSKIKENQSYYLLSLLTQKKSDKFDEDMANKLIKS